MNLPQAQQVAESAKLELLLTLLDELLEGAGASSCCSHQFTSMLDLIAAALQQRAAPCDIAWRHRRPRNAGTNFQAGQVPLFLISLKAGGVGLNLTTRPTRVIHYDPWWEIRQRKTRPLTALTVSVRTSRCSLMAKIRSSVVALKKRFLLCSKGESPAGWRCFEWRQRATAPVFPPATRPRCFEPID